MSDRQIGGPPSGASDIKAEHLRAAVELAPSGLLMVDPAGRIVLVNSEVERLFGYHREQLIGQPVEVLVPKRARDEHPGYRASFAEDPQTRSMGAGRELFGRRQDGSEFPVEIGLTPIEADDGLYVISSIVDISARKRAERHFRIAVEASPSGMVMVDARGTILMVNREVERLFGYDRDELLGQHIEMLVPERYRDQHPGFRAAFMRKPEARSMGSGRELFGLRKDGEEIPVEIGLSPIETDDGHLVLSSIVDISARKAAEAQREALAEQLKQSQKMEAVGQLAGGIAHDFNNILGAVIGYGELARRASDDESVCSDLDSILAAANRGRELVDRILRFSRREQNDREMLAPEQVLDASSRLLRATLPASIRLEAQIHEGTPRILADPTSLEMVLVNLSNNAAHAMPSGGDLFLAAEPFYAHDSFVRNNAGFREGCYVKISVRDEGVGMSPQVRERVFEPFFTTKPSGHGSGLGLAMVDGVIRDHGGVVRLESFEGIGTTVELYLPAAEELAERGTVPAEPRAGNGGRRILLVDDEPTLLEVGGRMLEVHGFYVFRTNEPENALDEIRRNPGGFDALLTDYSMPQMTGIELIRAARLLDAELATVLITGYLDQFDEQEARNAGVDSILKKPYTIDQIVACAAGLIGDEPDHDGGSPDGGSGRHR